jgi:hypothetical protein
MEHNANTLGDDICGHSQPSLQLGAIRSLSTSASTMSTRLWRCEVVAGFWLHWPVQPAGLSVTMYASFFSRHTFVTAVTDFFVGNVRALVTKHRCRW